MRTTVKIILISLLMICACSWRTTAKYTWACEDEYTSLDCGSDTIDVKVANYGRTDRKICSTGRPCHRLSNTNCLADNSLSQVKKRCDGRMACTVQASSLLFSDPCVDTYKYLEVLYHCVPPPERSDLTCEGNNGTLNCGSHIIQVQAANYGRTDGTTCADGRDANQTNTTNCLSTNTLSKVKEICEGRTSCEVEALNSIFSNPCPGIHKYLNITYNCVPPNSSQTCEGSRSTINCGSDHFIKVHLASYGRTDATICSTSRPANQVTNTNCYSDVLSTVRRECEGMVRCRIPVTNSFLSNPCPGTHKYLDITYSCVPPLSSQICEGNSTILDCGANVISIHTANYGRMDTHTCSAGLPAAAVAERKCFTSTARATLMELCHGMQTCMVTASDDVFQDVCPETYKYLDITYTCVDPASV